MWDSIANPWWSEKIYYYTYQALTDTIIEIKQARVDSKPLSNDSYDFVVTVVQVA